MASAGGHIFCAALTSKGLMLKEVQYTAHKPYQCLEVIGVAVHVGVEAQAERGLNSNMEKPTNLRQSEYAMADEKVTR